MLTPAEFEETFGWENVLEALPSRPITARRDVQYVYGHLYTLATLGDGEYEPYLTPYASRDLIGEPESLFVLRVDLSGEEPTLASDPVEVRSLSEGDLSGVAHCDYDAARGIDHSVTHRSGQRTGPEKMAEYIVERLTRWATDDVVTETAASHDDGWIVDALADLGDRADIVDEIHTAVERQFEGSATALVTVAVKLPGQDEFEFPGALAAGDGETGTDVFQAAMRARKRAKLMTKNKATDSSGEAVDLVSGERGQTVGTAEDPLNYFLGKQREKFPGLDIEQAWRTHPVSEDVAVTVLSAEALVENCMYRTLGAQVYYLPYFYGELTPATLRELYDVLYRLYTDEDVTPIERTYRLYGEEALDPSFDLRFYVTAIRRQQDKRYDAVGDTMNAALHHPVELDESHRRAVESWVFTAPRNASRSAPLPRFDNWDLLHPGSKVGAIATGWYFAQTFAPVDEDDVSADDYRVSALVASLSGDRLSVEKLLAEYVDRLREEADDEFPSAHVASQYAQLTALASADRLQASSPALEQIADQPAYTNADDNPMSDLSPLARTDGGSAAAARDAKLESFIDETPALNDNAERRSAFLLGALVGHVSGYQQSQGRSTTLVDQYPIKALTTSKIKRMTEEVLDKDITYSRERGLSGTMYAEVVDRLRSAIVRSDPDDWSIGTDDLRFYYALGVTYGMNDYTTEDHE